MMEFWNETLVKKSKKSHKCDLCGGEIPVGSRYVRQNGKYDGEFFDRSLHPWCENAIHAYCDSAGDNEYDQWDVVDFLRETVCSDCPEDEPGCPYPALRCPKVTKRYGRKEYE